MAAGKTKHVFAGPKDPETGEMLDEPVYVHQEYPRTLYHPDYTGWPTVGKVFADEAAVAAALADGWVRNPGELGEFTAPSQEQMQAKSDAEFEARRKSAKGKGAKGADA